MKCIHLFIASSVVEFENERRELGDYIRMLNDIYIEKDIYFKLTMCEDLSGAIELNGKQEFYNSKIRESDYFYVIFGKNAGEYTLQEFDVAEEHFKKAGAPRIYTYFQKLSDDEISDGVKSFMQRLDRELGHYYSVFDHLDSIKLNILLEFARNPELNSLVNFEDGQVSVNGDKVLSLKNIPVYAKNTNLQEALKEMSELDFEFSSAASEYAKDPENAELMRKMMDIGQRRGKLLENVRQMEKDMLELYTTVTRLKGETRALNWWEREAGRLLDLGDSEGALQILRDVELNHELEQAKSIAESGIERIRSVISAKKMAIQVLRTKGLNSETIKEICDNFEQIVKIAEEYQVDMECLYDYASFAYSQRKMEKAELFSDKVVSWCRYKNDLGKLYIKALMLRSYVFSETGRFDDAEKGYLEVREYYEKEKNLYEYANVNNSLGMMMCARNRAEQGISYSLEAIKTYASLSEKDPCDKNLCALANAYDTLSQIYNKLDRYEKARELSKKLYDILKKLSEENGEKYMARYASSCGHYALNLDKADEREQKQKLLLEALEIFKKLSEKDPAKYLPNVVWILYLMGGAEFDRNNEKAYQYYSEALRILEKLPEDERDHYTVNVDKVCSNLAVLLVKRNEKEEAEKMMLRVKDNRERLYSENSEVYMLPLADVYNNLLLFYTESRNIEKASEYSQKALKLVTETVSAQEEPAANVLNILATTYANVSNFFRAVNETELYESFSLQAREIFGSLYKKFGSNYEKEYFRSAHICASIYEKRGDIEKAEEVLKEAYEHYAKLGEPRREIPDISASLANFLTQRGEKGKVKEIIYEALRLMEKGYKEDKNTFELGYGQALSNAGTFLSAGKIEEIDFDEVNRMYGKALDVFLDLSEHTQGRMINYPFSVCRVIVKTYRALNKPSEAAALLLKAADRFSSLALENPVPYEIHLAIIYYDTANIINSMLSDKDKAKELLLKSLALSEKYPELINLNDTVKRVLEQHFN